MIEIDFEGVGMEALEEFIKDYPLIERTILESQGKMLASAIEYNIRAQRFEGPRAKLKTIGRKLGGGSNFPTDVWRDIGVVQMNVESRWLGDGEVGVGWYEETVGVDRIIAVKSLEYGSVKSNIAARPLVRPTAQAMAPRMEGDASRKMKAILGDLNSGRYRGPPQGGA